MFEQEMFDLVLNSQKAFIQNGFPTSYEIYKEYYLDFASSVNSLFLVKPEELAYEVSRLFTMEWAEFSLREIDSMRNVHDVSLFQTHFVYYTILESISEDLLSITLFVSLRMRHQAFTLLRNLYELCLLFIALSINDDLLARYIDSTKAVDSKQNWNRYFHYKKLLAIVQEWESQNNANIITKLSKGFPELYSHLSNYLHNDFLALVSSHVSNGNAPVEKKNSFNMPAIEVDIILYEMFFLLNTINQYIKVLVKQNNFTLCNKLGIKLDCYDDSCFSKFNYLLTCTGYFNTFLNLSVTDFRKSKQS